MKVIGYGIVGPGEATRYMEATLKEFKRLCDVTILLGNNTGPAERRLIKKYGFQYVEDNRVWGENQWRIKEDFARNHLSKIAEKGDWMVPLDMDEVYPPSVTKEKITALNNGDSFVVYIVNLWDEGYHKELSFWNVRLWRWNGDVAWEHKALHCGLAPLWARQFVSHAPFILLHYGLKKKDDRMKKFDRYQKFDPYRKFLPGNFYDQLRWDPKPTPLNIEALSAEVLVEVSKLKEKRKEVRGLMTNNYVELRRVSDGAPIHVEKRHMIHYEERIRAGVFQVVGDVVPGVEPEVQKAPVTENICIIHGTKYKTAKGLEAHNKKAHK